MRILLRSSIAHDDFTMEKLLHIKSNHTSSFTTRMEKKERIGQHEKEDVRFLLLKPNLT